LEQEVSGSGFHLLLAVSVVSNRSTCLAQHSRDLGYWDLLLRTTALALAAVRNSGAALAALNVVGQMVDRLDRSVDGLVDRRGVDRGSGLVGVAHVGGAVGVGWFCG
jgi:hypothetical protein